MNTLKWLIILALFFLFFYVIYDYEEEMHLTRERAEQRAVRLGYDVGKIAGANNMCLLRGKICVDKEKSVYKSHEGIVNVTHTMSNCGKFYTNETCVKKGILIPSDC